MLSRRVQVCAMGLALAVGAGGRVCLGADAERVLLARAQPVYPEIARRMGVGGAIVLEIQVDAEGRVTEVKAQSGHPLLMHAAEQAVRRWRYAAARESTTMTVNVDFKLAR